MSCIVLKIVSKNNFVIGKYYFKYSMSTKSARCGTLHDRVCPCPGLN